MSKNVLEKIINNGTEYYFPEGGGGSSDLDIGAVNALIDMKLGDYDSLFSVTNGLYQILNSIDTEDEIGLSSGDTRAEIVADDTSMSLISHCYAVMCYIANSTVAMSTILADASATDEISECWNSISIISESELASDLYLASVNGITSLFTYQTAQDAFFTSTARKTQIVSDNLMIIVNDDTLLAQLNTDSVVQACIVNSTTALSAIAGDNDKLEIVKENTAIMNAIAVNSTALAAMSDSDFFEYILEDSTYLTTCAGSTNGKAKINSYAADDLLDPIYFWTGDLGYNTFAALAADDTSMEIVQANTQAMLIINSNDEASEYIKWKPGTNTLSYFPLRTDFSDSLSNRTLSPYNVSISGGYAVLSTDTSRMPISSGISGSSITASVWFYYGQYNTSGSWSSIFVRSGGDYHHLLISGNTNDGKAYGRVGYYNKDASTKFQSGSLNLTPGNWYHIVVTKDGTNEKIYVNSELVVDNNNSFNNNSYPISIIGNYNGSGGKQGAIGKMCEVIFETGNWSQQYITKYFNKTKKEFGYS